MLYQNDFFFVRLFKYTFLPDICEKHCVNVVTTNPDDSAVANRTLETDAPTPAPAAAPHTMNTYKNDCKHSAIIDLYETRKKNEKIYIFLVLNYIVFVN